MIKCFVVNESVEARTWMLKCHEHPFILFHRLRHHFKEDNVPEQSEPMQAPTDVGLGTSAEDRKDLELVFQSSFLFVLMSIMLNDATFKYHKCLTHRAWWGIL